MNGKDLQTMLDQSRKVHMSPTERDAQRLSFAYGNTKIENDSITRETIKRAADNMHS
jgi:hypothetical protein